jgi:hypothetical protein
MKSEHSPMPAMKALEMYFLDNRARLLEIASFLDRIDRYDASSQARDDYRYKSFMKALETIRTGEGNRTAAVQKIFSDMTSEPIERVTDPKAYGAWEGCYDENH